MQETILNELNMIFDRSAFINQLKGCLKLVSPAETLGKRYANDGFNRIFFVGCGAPHYMMRVLAYWSRRYARKTDIRTYFSAEFVHQNPKAAEEKTLVILGSHSGSTPETVEAAEFLKSKICKTIAVTQNADSQLGIAADETLAYGVSEQGYYSSYIIAQTLVSAFLDQRESSWKFHERLMASLPNLPDALADAKASAQSLSDEQAHDLRKEEVLYIIGAGPMYTTAYVFSSCFLMEMQRMHAHPLVAAEFFHGPFEVVDESTPLIVLVGEDPSRVEAERVVHFCERYTKRFFIYDSRDFAMKDIHETIRPIIAPFILDAALTNLVEKLAVLRGHPMTLRRYMGKVDF